MNEKQIKAEIRRLRKVKLSCRAGSKERITLHRKIKALKNRLKKNIIIDDEKEALIKEIKKYKQYHIKLYKFTKEELAYHLQKLKGNKNEN